MDDGAVELARALCADAGLYGGHACLNCQQAARWLTRQSSDAAGQAREIRLPPHGTSCKASQSRWELALASLREEPGLPALGTR